MPGTITEISDIKNCGIKFAFTCPEKWELMVGSDDKVRYCITCGKDVTLCETLDEVLALLNTDPNACIACKRVTPVVDVDASMPRAWVGKPIDPSHRSRSDKLKNFIDSL